VTPDTGPVVVISRDGREVARFPLIGNPPPTLGAIDELARLRLLATRRGYEMRIDHPCDRLLWLLRFTGLEEVLLQMRGEAEVGEEVGVEEAVVADDPIA
jgi:hypothetical protein